MSAPEDANRPTRAHVPAAEGAVEAAAVKLTAVGRERQVAYRAFVAGQSRLLAPVGDRPKLDRVVVAGRRQDSKRRRERTPG